MNANGLAKHYGTLTPRERLPLIMAAAGRGDEEEARRLVAAAPKVAWSVPDHFGLAEAFFQVSSLHFMELLSLAGNYFHALGVYVFAKGEHKERAWEAALVLGYRLKAGLAGWRRYCAEEQFDPEFWWPAFLGLEQVQQAEKVAEKFAFTAEEMGECLKRAGDGGEVRDTDAVVADLRAMMQTCAKCWG
jgi:hypothetical protein